MGGVLKPFWSPILGFRVWTEAGYVDLGALSMRVIVKIRRRPEISREEGRGVRKSGLRLVCGNTSICKEDAVGTQYALHVDIWVK